MVGTAVSLDVLPLKRVQAIDDTSLEHLPPERTSEEKSRLLLQRLDFEESEEKDAKRPKSVKESAAQSKWPWQGLVESLQFAQQELSYILDFLTHVEANDAITIKNMSKPKQLLHETCSELALRASAKLNNFKKVGNYLRQTAKALEHQVDREAGFYGALMRLQQHWKVKRLRSTAGPVGNAGFTIDLSYPQMSPEMMWGLSARSAGFYSIDVEQDSNGLLFADLPSQSINSLYLRLNGPHIPHCELKDEGREGLFVLASHEKESGKNMEKEGETSIDRGIGKAVKTGANLAHSIFRRIQMAIIHEQIFEWTVREALQSSSGLVVTNVEERCLRLSLGHSCELVLELLKSTDAGPEWHNMDLKSAENDGREPVSGKLETKIVEPSNEEISASESTMTETGHGHLYREKAPIRLWKEMSTSICLEQAFYCSAFVHSHDVESTAIKVGQAKGDGTALLNKPRDFGSGFSQDAMIFEPAGPLKQFSLTMRHRIVCSKVVNELEKLAQRVPFLCLSCIPTWNSRFTAWALTLSVPKPVGEGWKMNEVSWAEAQKRRNPTFLLKVILCDASLFIEGLETTDMQDGAVSAEWKRSKHRCNLSDLSGLLLCQFAGQLVKWLHEEALVMGLNVKRKLFSLSFHVNSSDEFVLLACLDSQACSINWWLHVQSPKGTEDLSDEQYLNKSRARRFLGPLKPETLRSVLVDLISYCRDES